ncbi:ribosome small subunit-dependent GTPase A [Luteimonas huabeiensis]|uniref:ribosome small subunit-dependent GTPase A n=1 Tax=Luteimonas huabeiensis TaxID=1244513 RepID=UPI00046363CF|nr:ribosome small subunit-dependent GTPase A [Luteimonas huabeiensis]
MSLPPPGPAFDALRAIGWPFAGEVEDAAWRAALDAHPGAAPARVVEQHRTGYVVSRGPGDAAPAESLPAWQLARCPPEERAAVGDWVLVEDGRIVALLPRRTVIKRAAAGEHYRQQVIAANIDRVLVVSGLDGDFNPRRIERYLLLVRGGGAEPLVVLTKADRDGTDPQAARAALEAVLGGEVPVLALDARDRAGAEALRPWLGPGVTAVLVGSSGAGKSTLTNTLLGQARMRTAEVRARDDRGRHTTTHRALIPLPSGACLIDTPGMRELKPTGEEDLGENFADVEALAEACRFRDCRHLDEPGCAVRAAIEAGTLDRARYAGYLKLREEVAEAARQLAARRRAPAPGGRKRR